MAEKHTLEHLRTSRYLSRISDRNIRRVWENAGSRTLNEVAAEKVRQILRTYQPEPLPADVERA
jgi:trimethylamine--corrinoid protein Co-methyltransferase